MGRHFGRLPTGWEYPGSYIQRVCRTDLFDRFHVSELVYRAMDGRPTGLTPQNYKHVDAFIALHGGLIVCLCPPSEVIEERYNRLRREEMYDLRQILKVNDLFRSLCFNRELITDFGVFRPTIDMAISKPYDVRELADTILFEWSCRTDFKGSIQC